MINPVKTLWDPTVNLISFPKLERIKILSSTENKSGLLRLIVMTGRRGGEGKYKPLPRTSHGAVCAGDLWFLSKERLFVTLPPLLQSNL